MKWLLVAVLVFYGLTWWAYTAAQHGEVEDYSTVIPVLFCAVVSSALTAVYIFLALWRHQLL